MGNCYQLILSINSYVKLTIRNLSIDKYNINIVSIFIVTYSVALKKKCTRLDIRDII